MSAPIITAGTLDDGRRWVQVWDAEFRVGGKLPAGPLCMAWMGDGQNFGIEQGCPPEWVDLALGLFDAFRKGGTIVPTHEKTWEFGQPTFTPVKGDAKLSENSAVELDIEVNA